MLARLQAAVRSRLTPGTYRGPLMALAPVDFGLSLLAKRSYPAYQLWYRYCALTDRYFDRDPKPFATYDTALLESVRARGFALERGPFSTTEIQAARNFVLERYHAAIAHVTAIDSSHTANKHRFTDRALEVAVERDCGRTRFFFGPAALERADCPEAIRRFADVPELRALAAAYFGTATLLAQRPYYMAEVCQPARDLEPWHIDCIRPTLKTFLLLDDVGPEQAPMRYIPSSHRLDEARHQLFFRICNGGLGHAYFQAADCARFDAQATALTGTAGQLLVFDNQGVHAGSLCRAGLRITLANGYRPRATTRLNPRLFRDPAPVPYPDYGYG
jgi:hypothetical protein